MIGNATAVSSAVTAAPSGPRGVTGRDALVEARRAEIMNAAEQLLAVHGFDALRLKDVARRAGVSIGLIQHYFDSRDDLMLHTMREASRRRVTEWTDLATGSQSGHDKVASLVAGAISDPHRCAIWLETCAAASRHPELQDDVRSTQEAWRAALRAGIDDGLAAGQFSCAIPPDDVVDVLVGLIDGLMLATAAEGDGPTQRSHRNRLLRDTADRLLQPTSSFAASG